MQSCETIREMTQNDLSDVMQIERGNHPYPWSSELMSSCFKDNYSSFVYEKDEKIIGYLISTFAADESNILNVCVERQYRNTGIAKRLVNQAIKFCATSGIKSIFLEVRESNSAAINVYINNGFVEVGVRKNYYPHQAGKEDAIIMALELL